MEKPRKNQNHKINWAKKSDVGKVTLLCTEIFLSVWESGCKAPEESKFAGQSDP